jgi:excisionase family DNA binding protein
VSRAAREHDALTSTEAAALLGVSAATVKRWSDEGALPSIRTRGGHRRFRRVDVEELASRFRTDGAGHGTLAERLAAGETVLRIQADLLAERARSGSWRGAIDECVSALRAVANAQRTTGAPYVTTRIAHSILADALARCGDELPTNPGAPALVIAAVEDEPFTVALSLARLAARAAGWKAWSVGPVPVAELVAFATTGTASALLLYASIARSRVGIFDVVGAVEAACRSAGVALAVTGGASWPPPAGSWRLLRTLGEIPDWLADVTPPT